MVSVLRTALVPVRLCLWTSIVKFLHEPFVYLAVASDTSLGLVQVDDTSARADRPDEAQSEDGLAPEGLQVEEDVEDPVKAQELRLEGNEHFKARHPSFIGHEARLSCACRPEFIVAQGWTDLRSTRSLFGGFAFESASRRGGRRAKQGKGVSGTSFSPPFSQCKLLSISLRSKGRAVLHCNRAACLQRLGRWDDAVKAARLQLLVPLNDLEGRFGRCM